MNEPARRNQMTVCAAEPTFGWQPEWVLGAIRARGLSLTALAQRLGVETATIGKVVRGRTTSRRIERAIAKLLGVRAADIWPDRYPRGAR